MEITYGKESSSNLVDVDMECTCFNVFLASNLQIWQDPHK